MGHHQPRLWHNHCLCFSSCHNLCCCSYCHCSSSADLFSSGPDICGTSHDCLCSSGPNLCGSSADLCGSGPDLLSSGLHNTCDLCSSDLGIPPSYQHCCEKAGGCYKEVWLLLISELT